MSEPAEAPSEARRRAIFAALVEAQDGGLSVPASRTAVAARFNVSPDELAVIEREGIQEGWPPL